MNIMFLTPSLTCNVIREELNKSNREYLLSQKIIGQQSKDSINTLQNNNFIETMKHINLYKAENIPSMDPELLVVISLQNLQRMKSKKR